LLPADLTTEPIYGTRYNVTPVPASWLATWSNAVSLPELHLPAQNPFVPDDLTLRAAAGPREGLPELLLQNPAVRVWQRTELRFESPKSAIVLDFQVLHWGCHQGVATVEPASLSRHTAGMASDFVVVFINVF
jgi:secreted Zn-dependent insulinase-like peptidase